jgi:phospholipase D1/2
VDNNLVKFPGIDYCNPYSKDFPSLITSNDKTNLNYDGPGEVEPRMPWHDVGILVVGQPAKDLSYHFNQYWEFAQQDFNNDEYKHINDNPKKPKKEEEKKEMEL